MQADDLDAVLVEWLGEILYVHEARGVALCDVGVSSVGSTGASGYVAVTDLADEPSDGVPVKAITYHQLEVRRQPDGSWSAQVFLDI